MKISVVVVSEILGTLTHATSAPLELVYFSISWLSLVVPSSEVKRMSFPVDRAWACKPVSVWLTRTGKPVTPPDPTLVGSIESFFRYSQEALYQAAVGNAADVRLTRKIFPSVVGTNISAPVSVLTSPTCFVQSPTVNCFSSTPVLGLNWWILRSV